MATLPIMMLAERARADSLFKRLERVGYLADFFSWFYSGRREEKDCLAWLGEREVKSSGSAIEQMISRHGLAWRAAMAEEASDAQGGMLPEDVEERIKRSIQAQTFDLTLQQLGTKEVLFLEKMRRKDAQEKEKLDFNRTKTALSARLKRQQLRQDLDKFRHRIKTDTEKALDAFAEEIRGNPAAEGALAKLRQSVEAAVS